MKPMSPQQKLLCCCFLWVCSYFPGKLQLGCCKLNGGWNLYYSCRSIGIFQTHDEWKESLKINNALSAKYCLWSIVIWSRSRWLGAVHSRSWIGKLKSPGLSKGVWRHLCIGGMNHYIKASTKCDIRLGFILKLFECIIFW